MSVRSIGRTKVKTGIKVTGKFSGGVLLLLIFAMTILIFGQVQVVVQGVHRLVSAYNVSEEMCGVMEMFDRIGSKPDSYMIEVPGISQADIPTGCESVSTVAVLQYCGIEITPEMFISNYLPCEAFYRKNGTLYGPDPNMAFAGNPFAKESLGCFPQVIIQALGNMSDSQYEGMENIAFDDVSGVDLEMLEEIYLAKNVPVILWVTSGMKASYPGMQYYLEDGSLYTWQANEHCLVLCGYDAEYYYLMDPQVEGQVVSYTKELVASRYEEMGKCAVVVMRR